LFGNLAIGLSYGWWIDKHNRHHAHPNDDERDPDVYPGALVFSPDHVGARRGFARMVTRVQAYLFFPMLVLEGANLHIAGFRALRERQGSARWIEASLLVAHVVGYAALVFLVLSPWQALAFIAIQQGVFGLYMGCSFAPNHKGMPPLTPEQDADFLRRQVLTSRNIRGSRVIDFVFGGLNYQIEHHLFPSMPRPNLRRAQPIVREFCNEVGVSYLETGIICSYRQALGHLHAIGEPLRSGGQD
jgi:fatty acid desaturase